LNVNADGGEAVEHIIEIRPFASTQHADQGLQDDKRQQKKDNVAPTRVGIEKAVNHTVSVLL
jgi:hypothetical protein